MLASLAKSIFGSANDRYVAKLGKTVETIAGYEPATSAMTDEELRAASLARALAADREAAKRAAAHDA